MQVTETKAEGLVREYKVAIPAGDMQAKIDSRIEEVAKTVNLPGFRPGKVPLSVVKSRYANDIKAEALQQTVQDTWASVLEEQKVKPALQPSIEDVSFEDGEDLVYQLKVEILPEVGETDFKAVKVERMVVEAADADVDEAVTELAKNRKDWKKCAKTAKAKAGQRVLIDFVGSVDGVEFEGGKGENYPLELGSGTFIPGFEDQLVGVKTGDEVDVTVTFPENYGSKDLAGKEALFKCTVHEIQKPVDAEVDDELAKGFGFDDLAALKAKIAENLAEEFKQVARGKTKRELLDALAEQHTFDVPPTMVEMELNAIKGQAKQEAQMKGEEAPSEEDLDKEYGDIAVRRVRLGLVLSSLAEKAELSVTQDELNAAIVEQARSMPGQEQFVIEYFQKNPQAIEQLRAPILEEKVVDYILEQVEVTEKSVTKDELKAIIEADDEE